MLRAQVIILIRKHKLSLQNSILIQNAYKDLACSAHWLRPLAVTLTLKQGIELGTGVWKYLDRDTARTAILYFFNELDRRCYPKIKGKRSGKTTRFVVIEGGKGIRSHYHLLIDCPPHVEPAIFAAWIREIWTKAIWGYNQIDIQPADIGWLDYMLKLDSKIEYSDCVELIACHGLSGDKL